ncbi:MAG: twin-arginine translocase TatA/TatE family subunit [Gammaproteobacteria bacterium]|nr:twin-arginine translocase TatA/TatE family subunit [Gammaproteobacteria bacterium]MDH3374553.1 twin-arginine translocase TatA/TatE family subunit [Gammaproteobacteria bacterium]MDH3408560.1 twin-arginine translocase TatA/TatE family subunit [Gammaproteobacteria bacterium]MDH3553444.1 twin-arginine translocase TatA/TatE family subunit [Gammaproteobacteria bacterium]
MLSGISWPQLLIVLVIVLAIFGTKRFRTLGSDLGNAVKGFRSAMSDAEEAKDQLSEDKGEDKGEDANFDNTPVEENRKDA